MKMILFVVFFFALSGAVYAPAAPKQETVVATPVKQAPIAFPQCEVEAAKRCLNKCKAHCNNGVGNGPDCRPGRARRDNDDRCGVPGAPGNQGGGKLGTEYVTKEKGDNTVVNADLVFQGDLAGTWKRTECQDKCEDAEFAACEKPAPAVVAAPTCQLTPRSVADCTAESKKAHNCDDCFTTKCKTCRTVYIEVCSKPQRRADLESCLKLSAGAADVPRTRKAIAALCAEQTCAEKPAVEQPQPAAVPKPVVYDAPKVEPKVEAPKVEEKKPEAPKPVVYEPVKVEPKVEAPKVEAPKVEEKKPEAPKPVVYEPVKVEPKVEVPKVEVPKVVDVPCDHAVADADLPRVIYLAAEEEDCTTALKAEVADLQLLVDKLSLLLTAKGLKIGTGEKCTIPGLVPPPSNTPGTSGGNRNGDATTGNGNGGNPPGTSSGNNRNGEATTGNGNGGTKDAPKTSNGNGNPSTTRGNSRGKSRGTSRGGTGNGGSTRSGESTTRPGENNGGEGSGRDRLQTNSGSSAAVNSMAVVAGVIGAAVAAGVAAVAIGAAVGASSAVAAAPASAAPMASAAINPLYSSLTAGGTNMLA